VNVVRIGKFSPINYFHDVARIHATEIQVGLLSKLGVAFLTSFYRYVASDRDCALFAAVEDEKVVGFVSGTKALPEFYRRFMMRRGFALGAYFFLHLIRSWTLPRVGSFRRYLNSNESTSLPTAELMSLAVGSGCQRRGLGKILFAEFQEYFRGQGIAAFKVAAAVSQTAALRFYPTVGGKLAARTYLGELEAHIFVCHTRIDVDVVT